MSRGAVLCCHSPALSYLLYECSCSNSDQKGLLLGSVKSHTISSITDDPALHEETKTIVYIEHSVPLPDKVFGSFAEISEQSIKNWIEPYKEKLIGWYSARRHYKASKPSLREIFIHQRFLNLMNTEDNDPFVFGSLTTISPYPQSTHSFHYAFHTFNTEVYSFVEFPLKICNLSDRTYDSAGCLESCLYPEAQNFRALALNAENSAGTNIADPLRNYVGNCTKTLREMCEALFKLEVERLMLENSVARFRQEVFGNRPAPVVQMNLPAAPIPDEENHLLCYDAAKDYSNGEVDQLVFDEDLDEKMDMSEFETVESDSASSPTVPSSATQELRSPNDETEFGEEPSTEPETGLVGNAGDAPAPNMDVEANSTAVRSDFVQSGNRTQVPPWTWHNRHGNSNIPEKNINKPANSNS